MVNRGKLRLVQNLCTGLSELLLVLNLIEKAINCIYGRNNKSGILSITNRGYFSARRII